MSTLVNNGTLLTLKKIGLGVASVLVPLICFAISVFFIANSNVLIIGRFGRLAQIARTIIPFILVIVGCAACYSIDPSNHRWISKTVHIILFVLCLTAIVLLFIYNYVTPVTEALGIEIWLLFTYGCCLYILFKTDKEDKK